MKNVLVLLLGAAAVFLTSAELFVLSAVASPQDQFTVSLSLQRGWNAIAFSGAPCDPLGKLFPKEGPVSSVWTFQEGTWYYFLPSGQEPTETPTFGSGSALPNSPPIVNLNSKRKLKEIIPNLGYMVFVSGDQNYTLSYTTAFRPTSHKLTNGWNLIGFNCDRSMPKGSKTIRLKSLLPKGFDLDPQTSELWMYRTRGWQKCDGEPVAWRCELDQANWLKLSLPKEPIVLKPKYSLQIPALTPSKPKEEASSLEEDTTLGFFKCPYDAVQLDFGKFTDKLDIIFENAGSGTLGVGISEVCWWRYEGDPEADYPKLLPEDDTNWKKIQPEGDIPWLTISPSMGVAPYHITDTAQPATDRARPITLLVDRGAKFSDGKPITAGHYLAEARLHIGGELADSSESKISHLYVRMTAPTMSGDYAGQMTVSVLPLEQTVDDFLQKRIDDLGLSERNKRPWNELREICRPNSKSMELGSYSLRLELDNFQSSNDEERRITIIEKGSALFPKDVKLEMGRGVIQDLNEDHIFTVSVLENINCDVSANADAFCVTKKKVSDARPSPWNAEEKTDCEIFLYGVESWPGHIEGIYVEKLGPDPDRNSTAPSIWKSPQKINPPWNNDYAYDEDNVLLSKSERIFILGWFDLDRIPDFPSSKGRGVGNKS